MKLNPTAFLAVLAVAVGSPSAGAQGTAFSYQGHLTEGSIPANGAYDLRCILYDASVGGSQAANIITNPGVAVSNGLFATQLDFGPSVFNGMGYWLELAVRPASGGSFVPVLPRQNMTPVPYALYSPSAGTAATCFGVAANAVTGAGIQDAAITAGKIAAGQAVKSLNGLFDTVALTAGANVTLTTSGNNLQLAASDATRWSLTGNGGTTAGANFLGTTDNQPLELAVNHARALRLEPNTNGAPNVIGGASVNLVQPGVVGATIAGGGAANYENFSFTNSVSADLGSIGGGGGNAIETNAPYSTIGGGAQNTIRAAAWYSTIGGGKRNTIQTNAYQSTIGGGFVNTIEAGAGESTISGGNNNLIDSNALVSTIGGGADNFIRAAAQEATIGGGNRNLIQTSAAASTIAGGDGNTIWSGAAFATIGGGLNNVVTGGAGTIPGGSNNFAGGNSSFAAGNRAKARDDGAFVWAGGNTIDYGSGMPNRFHVYALNGLVVDYDVQRSDGGGSRWILVGAETQFPGEAIATSTGAYLSSGGQWVNSSDRNVKADFHAITPRKVLAKVARLSVQTWRYTNEVATVRHLGPMAQDFHAAFGLGDSDKTIGTVDETGVALAAIQGLNEKLDEEVKAKEQEINELELRNNALERRLSALESLVGSAPAR